MSSREVFDTLQNLSRDYIFVMGNAVIVKNEDEVFVWEDELTEQNVTPLTCFPTEMVTDALQHFSLEELVGEEGFYTFESTLKAVYTPYGDFDGFEVDIIELRKHYDLDQHRQMQKELENFKWSDDNEVPF